MTRNIEQYVPVVAEAGLNSDKAVDFDSTLNVQGAVTLQSTLNVTGAITGDVTGDVTGDTTGSVTLGTASLFNLGAAETPTIASGVLTVTRPFVNPQPESSTADQVDSIVYTGATEGSLLIVHVPATNTITFDDANINLGAATRAVAPGGSIIFVYDGTQWTELTFLTASDNA